MAETRLTNVVVPDIFTGYTFEPWYERSRFFSSGIIVPSTEMNSLLDGGGQQFDMPFWQPLSGDATIPSETVDETVNAITATKQIARRQERNKTYGANALSAIEAGADPLDRFANDVRAFWTKDYDKNLVNSCTGVLLDNVANDSSDLLKDDSGSVFNDDGIIDAMSLLGENGVVGRNDSTDFVGIAVHPTIYATMRKNDQIDFVPISGQTRPVPFYMGLEVVVDRNMPTDGGTPAVYTSILFKRGAFVFGQSSARYEPTSVDRNEKAGMGVTEITTRRVYAVHPLGFQWSEGSVAGVSPTNAELALATNWDRVYNAENVGVVFYYSKA